jgi:RHS repeat-associated protein
VTTSLVYQTTGSLYCAPRGSEAPDNSHWVLTPGDGFNLPTSITDPLTHATTLTYDSQRKNLTNVADPLGHSVSMTYNSTGNLTSISNADGSIQTSYSNGFPNSLTDPLQRQVSFQYDGVWRLKTATDPAGNKTQYAYTPLNQISQITDALNGLTSFAYDPNGNLLTLTDANYHATTYTYDNMDRVATRTDPLYHSESYQYDLNGNLTLFTDRKSQPTNYQYDALNRLKQVTFADQSTITYTWDAGNRLTQVVDSLNGTITRSYDGLDRLLSETTAQGTVSYTYDAAGRRSTMSASGQLGISYTYDNANRLTQITQGTAVASIAYDNANLRTSLTLPNGVVLAYTYDIASELTGLTWTKAGATLANITYGYDYAGRMTQMASSLGGGNLPTAVSPTTYNAANQLTQWGAATLSYDLNGNLTSDGTYSYTWNARNQLVGGNLQYDALGRRTRNPAGTSFLYDGLNPIQELSGSTATANLLTGLGIDEIFSRTDSTGTSSFLTDRLGSTAALADSAGNLQTLYTYEPFGKTTTTGTVSSNPYQFTGRENDPTGLYYLRARYYNPTLQRFISEDPARPSGGDWNLYKYAGDDPITGIDPTGLWSPQAHDALVQHALGPCDVSSGDISAIQSASRTFDAATGLSATYANWHALAQPGQSPDAALQQIAAIIASQLQYARDIWQNGDKSLALSQLGIAIHPIMDLTSPAHTALTPRGRVPYTWPDPLNILLHSITDKIVIVYRLRGPCQAQSASASASEKQGAGPPGAVAGRYGRGDRRTPACERSRRLGDSGPSGLALAFGPAGSSWRPGSRSRRSAGRPPGSPVAGAGSHSAAANPRAVGGRSAPGSCSPVL